MEMNINQIEEWLINLKPDDMQSISQLIEVGQEAAVYIAYSGGEVARCKRAYLNAKRAAYNTAITKLKEQNKDVPPSLVKDYITTIVAKEEEAFILADRVNASLTHTLDFIRTCISALKAEMQSLSYQK
jgi:hypothetical protein